MGVIVDEDAIEEEIVADIGRRYGGFESLERALLVELDGRQKMTAAEAITSLRCQPKSHEK